jgi:hypothetical protein
MRRLESSTSRVLLAAAWAVAVAASLMGAAPARAAVSGLTWASTACETEDSGSSNPTFYASNHRMVVTEGGRTLAVYDAHDAGQQLKWRNPGGEWRSDTTGATSNGYLTESLPNDRPASLALTTGSDGRERGWLVWAGYGTTAEKLSDLPLELRRLSDLDSSAGPTVGNAVTVEPAGLGNLRPDVAFEGDRGVVTWIERRSTVTYALMVAWFEDGSSPTLHDRVVLDPDVGSEATATLVPTPDGMKLVARTGRLEIFSHAAGDPLATWRRGDGVSASAYARPSAVALGSGDVLAAVESDTTNHVVEVVRFARATDNATISLGPVRGYNQPSVATDGSNAWVVMVRSSDGYLVSRQLTAGRGWSSTDRVEVGDEAGGDYEWPNLVRDASDGRLRLLLDARRCPDHRFRNQVASYERAVDVTPSLSVASTRLKEGDSGTKLARFQVSLSRPVSDTVSVAYSTSDGSATAPSDYQAGAGRLTFEPGDTAVTVAVAVRGDTVDEPDERFFVNLESPSNATIADGRGRAGVSDDDPAAASMSLKVRVRRLRIRASGTVTLDVTGRRVIVVLWRKRHHVFEKVEMKRPYLEDGRRMATSDFHTHFARPRAKTCRVTARLTKAYSEIRARRTFTC